MKVCYNEINRPEVLNALIRKEAEQEEQESDLAPTATSTTTTEAEEIPTTTNEPEVTTRKPPKITRPRQQQIKELISGDTKRIIICSHI